MSKLILISSLALLKIKEMDSPTLRDSRFDSFAADCGVLPAGFSVQLLPVSFPSDWK